MFRQEYLDLETGWGTFRRERTAILPHVDNLLPSHLIEQQTRRETLLGKFLLAFVVIIGSLHSGIPSREILPLGDSRATNK